MMRMTKHSQRPECPAARLAKGCLAALLLFLALGCAESSGETGVSVDPPPVAQAERMVPADAAAIKLSFAPLVRAAAPAVVSITSSRVTTSRGVDPFFDDPFFRHFFGDLGPLGRRPPRQRQQTSLGSGVIVDPEGLVVTNHHVVEGADEITVILADRTEHAAEIVQSDERSDLAFLRIDPGKLLPALPLGDSDAIETGDLVLAIGNPFGIGQTVTSGIVSAEARATPGARGELSFIQTDAAINPGNSGGALVSMDGELIGVNTAIFTRGGGGSIGIGFAIPANLVAARLQAIEQGIGVTRPWLGAEFKPVDIVIARALGLTRPVGVLIERVHPRGAAAKAGLEPGDVLISIDGVEVADAPGVNLRLQLKPLGARVRLKILRRNEERTLDLPLEAPPAEPPPDQQTLTGNHPLSGAVVANLSPAFNEALGIDLFAEGVGIVGIEPRTFATRLRMRRGDIIVAIDDNRVHSIDELQRLLRDGRRRWTISIERGGQIFDLTVG